MRSHEALQKAIAGKTVEHAKRLGLCTSSVSKWQEPHTDFTDSGSYNPLDRIETIIETARSQGNADAAAPIHYLAHKFGMIIIPIPQMTGSGDDLTRELLQTVKEFGDLAQVASKHLSDGRITRKEAQEIDREAWELIQQVTVFLKKTQESVR